eukprot:gene14121-16242_t
MNPPTRLLDPLRKFLSPHHYSCETGNVNFIECYFFDWSAHEGGKSVKLALELSKRDTGRTLYILDEPTTGLHFADIDLLLKVLHQLRDAGNTIVIIEHNLDVIKTADWLIDMGPEGGAGGGTVLGEGTPEQLAKNKASFTGHYLARLLKA